MESNSCTRELLTEYSRAMAYRHRPEPFAVGPLPATWPWQAALHGTALSQCWQSKVAQQQSQWSRLLPRMLQQRRMHGDLSQCWGRHSSAEHRGLSPQREKTPRLQSAEVSPPRENKLRRADGLHTQHWLDATTGGVPVTGQHPAMAPAFSPHRCSM